MKHLVFMCGSLVATSSALAQVQYTVADRSSITSFLSESSIDLTDLNNDCSVSDVDAALLFDTHLTMRYGPELDVGDIDLNGVVDGEDVVAAIASVVFASFGELTDSDEEVTLNDVQAVADLVLAGIADADVNLDGVIDVLDIMAVEITVGSQISSYNVEIIAREIFDYVGEVREHGREAFMAVECAPEDHDQRISNGWPSNHLTNVSLSYDNAPYGYDHAKKTSKIWPANHFLNASQTWPKYTSPQPHNQNTSEQLAHHTTGLSSTWPPNHNYDASKTWPAPGVHEITTSEGWWPGHTNASSQTRLVPPLHQSRHSSTWVHGVESSQASFPPNHAHEVSNNWPPAHNALRSAGYPPAHAYVISESWPGPQPGWPANHVVSTSEPGPAPRPWPVLPENHNWWDTFLDLAPLVPAPRIPWP